MIFFRQLNLIIAMMSNTIDKKSKNNSTKWKTEILLHIELFEKFFPELREFAHSPTVVRVYPKIREIQPDKLLIYPRSCKPDIFMRASILFDSELHADSRLERHDFEGPARDARDRDLRCAIGSYHDKICNCPSEAVHLHAALRSQ
jgi:hypothetical protein